LPPQACPNLELYPRGHPSARHSKISWANQREVSESVITFTERKFSLFIFFLIFQLEKYPNLYNAEATEVVLSMGDVLYVPGYWFHYIISQDASIQCNARSGESLTGKEAITQCGFIKRKEIASGGLEVDEKDGTEGKTGSRKKEKKELMQNRLRKGMKKEKRRSEEEED
jgi:hypothetical protein